jgi:hypothetical protein
MNKINEQELAKMMEAGINANLASGLIQMNDDDLQNLMKAVNVLVEIRKPKNLIPITWEGTVGDVRKGKPYFALLSNVAGKIDYRFVSTISYESKKPNSGATAVFTGELPEGTIVRHRDGASWKNDYSEYSIITHDGMKEITEIEAKRALGIIK